MVLRIESNMKLLLLSSISFFALASVAIAQVPNSSCDPKPARETVIYIDQLAVLQSKSLWPLQIPISLQTSLMPGEPVHVEVLSPSNGTSNEIWQGCQPGFNATADSNLDDQQTEFSSTLNNVLGGVYSKDSKPDEQLSINAFSPPHKTIIPPLFKDLKTRLQQAKTVRVILYSDLAENNSNGSVFSSNKLEHLKGNIVGSVFYVFGLNTTVEHDKHYKDEAINFWQNTISQNGGVVSSISNNFFIPNVIPVKSFIYNVKVSLDNTTTNGKLSLMTDKNGVLVDSWIGINGLTGVVLDGSFFCVANQCRLDAQTNAGLVGFDNSEILELSGTKEDSLKGVIKVNAQMSVALTAKF
jgi:hypothetical protein